MSFRFAIMGAGHIAHKFCGAVRLLQDAQVIAVASSSAERAADFAAREQIPSAYGSYEEMLLKEKPDCVYIAVITSMHYELSMLCAKHSVPVLCEKAMFRGTAQAQSFFELAAQKKLFAMEAMWSRFLPANIEAKRLLKEGAIGDPVSLEAAIGFAAPMDPGNRYFSPALGGGAAFDLTVYAWELSLWMLDSSQKHCSCRAVMTDTGVDGTDAVLLMTRNNVPVQLLGSLMSPLREHLTIHGTKGTIVIPTPHFASGFTMKDLHGQETHWQDDRTRNGFVYEAAQAVRCIREGLTESPVIPWQDTLDCAAFFDTLLSRDS